GVCSPSRRRILPVCGWWRCGAADMYPPLIRRVALNRHECHDQLGCDLRSDGRVIPNTRRAFLQERTYTLLTEPLHNSDRSFAFETYHVSESVGKSCRALWSAGLLCQGGSIGRYNSASRVAVSCHSRRHASSRA